MIREYHKRKSTPKKEESFVMIGNDSDSTFIKAKNGERVMIGFGEYSCFVEVGLTIEESRMRLDDKLDDLFYSKPVALIKKLARRINK